MLILRRKAGESLVIGDEIKVTVMDINEGSIRLAIDAPKRITILRTELLQAASANRDAAEGSQAPLTLLKGSGGTHPIGRRFLGGRPRKPRPVSTAQAAEGSDAPSPAASAPAVEEKKPDPVPEQTEKAEKPAE